MTKLITYKPKYKVGDWLIRKNRNSLFLVDEVCSMMYISQEQGYGICFDEEDEWRKWATTDVKVGEMYVTKKKDVVFVKEITLRGAIFCYIIANDAVALTKIDTIKCPATKEQKEAFFKSLLRKGYLWDSFKREFKALPFAVGDVVRCLKGYGKTYNITDIDKYGYLDGDTFITPFGQESLYERLNVKPIFKVGDVIVPKCYNEEYEIVGIKGYSYILDNGMNIPFKDQDLWETAERHTLRRGRKKRF